MSTASYLDRFLEPVTNFLTPDVASAFAKLSADPQLQAEIEEFRRKANEGTLTLEEEAEYKDLVEAIDVMSIIQSKARQYLKTHPA